MNPGRWFGRSQVGAHAAKPAFVPVEMAGGRCSQILKIKDLLGSLGLVRPKEV